MRTFILLVTTATGAFGIASIWRTLPVAYTTVNPAIAYAVLVVAALVSTYCLLLKR